MRFAKAQFAISIAGTVRLVLACQNFRRERTLLVDDQDWTRLSSVNVIRATRETDSNATFATLFQSSKQSAPFFAAEGDGPLC